MNDRTGPGDLGARLRARWARGAEFLGCPVPIVCGAMSWVSTHGLVAAVSEAGGFGVLAASAMPPEDLRDEIAATRAATARPFGVNVVTLHPRFDDVVAVCAEARVEHVILAGGLPPAPAIRALKDAGAKVTCFAPVVPVAKRLIRAGVDALVVEGNEAGGHVGPTSTLVLAQEILPHTGDTPVFIAGGIATGAAVVACLELGAVGCQLGTRFAACTESPAHADFKAALVRAQSRDAVISPRIDPRLKTIPVRALHNRAMDDFLAMQRELLDALDRGEIGPEVVQERAEHFWAGRLRRAVVNGDVEQGSLMAGQGVALVKGGETAAEIVESLARDAREMMEAPHGG